MAVATSINEQTTGITGFTGTGFTGTPVTNHAIIVGGATTSTLTSVGPSATSGQILQSTGASSDPAFSSSTFPSTATTGDILYASNTNVWSILPAGTNGNALLQASGIPSWKNNIKTTTYTAANTWTPDPLMKFAKLYIWQGGGGGGSGRCGATIAAGGGAGGGAGFFAMYELLASNLQSPTYSITIGGGGNGGSAINATLTNGNPGGSGGFSAVGSIIGFNSNSNILFNFGAAGTNTTSIGGTSYASLVTGSLSGGNAAAGGNGVTTGVTAASVGTTSSYLWATGGAGAPGYAATVARVGAVGGAVVNGDFSSTIVAGGLAGSAGGTGGDGNPATAFELFIGGTGGGSGGHNGTVTAGSGGNGGTPSGGGGGGAGNLSLNASGAGGNGARGQIIIVEFL